MTDDAHRRTTGRAGLVCVLASVLAWGLTPTGTPPAHAAVPASTPHAAHVAGAAGAAPVGGSNAGRGGQPVGRGRQPLPDDGHPRLAADRPPPQPAMSQLSMEYGGACKGPEETVWVRSAGQLYARGVTDPDGDSVSVQFRADWDAGDGKGVTARWTPDLTAPKASGSDFAIRMPAVPTHTPIRWYARVHDGTAYSPWSWAGPATGCYFVYDTQVPAAPLITSDDYPEALPTGAVESGYDGSTGSQGAFTFDAADTDVDRYVYGVDGDPAPGNEVPTSGGAPRTVQILPGGPGLHFVTAQSVDRAGNVSEIRTYQFLVAAGQPDEPAPPVTVAGRWKLDRSSQDGDDTVSSPDDVPDTNAATLHGGASVDPSAAFMGDGGLLLDGVDDYAATSRVPVDTAHSFTVTAWAQATADLGGSSRAVLSAAGTRQSAFTVGFVPDPHAPGGRGTWRFTAPDRDAEGPTVAHAENAADFSDVREWNHLALVYDGSARRAELYVNGHLTDIACTDEDGDGEADDSACTDAVPWTENVVTFPADESLQIGRAMTDGSWGQYWPGAIDDVWAFQGALSGDQVSRVAGEWFDLPTEVPDVL